MLKIINEKERGNYERQKERRKDVLQEGRKMVQRNGE